MRLTKLARLGRVLQEKVEADILRAAGVKMPLHRMGRIATTSPLRPPLHLREAGHKQWKRDSPTKTQRKLGSLVPTRCLMTVTVIVPKVHEMSIPRIRETRLLRVQEIIIRRAQRTGTTGDLPTLTTPCLNSPGKREGSGRGGLLRRSRKRRGEARSVGWIDTNPSGDAESETMHRGGKVTPTDVQHLRQ